LLDGGAAAPVASGGARYTVCMGDASVDDGDAGNKMDHARFTEKRARSKNPSIVSSAGRASIWKPCRLVAPVRQTQTIKVDMTRVKLVKFKFKMERDNRVPYHNSQ
jgi:hypothetical protein